MDGEIVVIGAGQCRTGTLSLCIALERLLGAKCYHMREVIVNRSHIPLWLKAAKSGTLSEDECRCIFANYRATVDYPGAPIYQEILRVYPKAKVILSTRDAKSWVKSCRGTVFSANIHGIAFRLVSLFGPMRNFSTMVRLLVERCLGTDFDIENEEASVRAFNAWNESVKATVPVEQLLVFEAKEGWEPLCKFLVLPIPDEPYPRVHSTEDFNTHTRIRNQNAWMMLIGVSVAVGAVGAVSWMAYRKWFK